MNKKFLLLLLGILPISVLAEIVVIDGIRYDLNGNIAEVTDGNYSGDVVIPETISYEGKEWRVTSIGRNAFNSQVVSSINLPNSITTIKSYAFCIIYGDGSPDSSLHFDQENRPHDSRV